MTSRTDQMSASISRAAYISEYRKRKRLGGDNGNNVPKRTKLHAERQRDYRERKAQKNEKHKLVIVVLHI
jgi:hypothetical protein